MANFTEFATLKVIDEASGPIAKINAELAKLRKTANSLKSIHEALNVNAKPLATATANLEKLAKVNTKPLAAAADQIKKIAGANSKLQASMAPTAATSAAYDKLTRKIDSVYAGLKAAHEMSARLNGAAPRNDLVRNMERYAEATDKVLKAYGTGAYPRAGTGGRPLSLPPSVARQAAAPWGYTVTPRLGGRPASLPPSVRPSARMPWGYAPFPEEEGGGGGGGGRRGGRGAGGERVPFIRPSITRAAEGIYNNQFARDIGNAVAHAAKEGVEESSIGTARVKMLQLDSITGRAGAEAEAFKNITGIVSDKVRQYGPGTPIGGAGGFAGPSGPGGLGGAFFNAGQTAAAYAEMFTITGEKAGGEETTALVKRFQEVAMASFAAGNSMEKAAEDSYNYARALDAAGKLTYKSTEEAEKFGKKMGDFDPAKAEHWAETLAKIQPEVGKWMTGEKFRQQMRYMSSAKYGANEEAIAQVLLFGPDVGTRAAVGYNQLARAVIEGRVGKKEQAFQRQSGLTKAVNDHLEEFSHDLPGAFRKYIMGWDEAAHQPDITKGLAGKLKDRTGKPLYDVTTPEGATAFMRRVGGTTTAQDAGVAMLRDAAEFYRKYGLIQDRKGDPESVRRAFFDNPRVMMQGMQNQIQGVAEAVVTPLMQGMQPQIQNLQNVLTTWATGMKEQPGGVADFVTGKGAAVAAGLASLGMADYIGRLATGQAKISDAGPTLLMQAGSALLTAAQALSTAAAVMARSALVSAFGPLAPAAAAVLWLKDHMPEFDEKTGLLKTPGTIPLPDDTKPLLPNVPSGMDLIKKMFPGFFAPPEGATKQSDINARGRRGRQAKPTDAPVPVNVVHGQPVTDITSAYAAAHPELKLSPTEQAAKFLKDYYAQKEAKQPVYPTSPPLPKKKWEFPPMKAWTAPPGDIPFGPFLPPEQREKIAGQEAERQARADQLEKITGREAERQAREEQAKRAEAAKPLFPVPLPVTIVGGTLPPNAMPPDFPRAGIFPPPKGTPGSPYFGPPEQFGPTSTMLPSPEEAPSLVPPQEPSAGGIPELQGAVDNLSGAAASFADAFGSGAGEIESAASSLASGGEAAGSAIEGAASSLAAGGAEAASIIQGGASAAGAAYGAAAAAAISAAAANVHINVSTSGGGGGKADPGRQTTTSDTSS